MTRIVRFPVDRSQPSSAILVPVVPLRGRIPDDIDATLSRLAKDERRSQPAFRNALLSAYWPILHRICRRIWWQSADRGIIDREDVEHEGVLLFFELLTLWPGEDSFSRYLLGRFRWRLLERTRRLSRRPTSDQIEASLAVCSNDSYAAERALELLREIIDPLSPFDRELVLLRVVDGHSFPAIGRRLGVSTSSIETRWRALRDELYRNLQFLLNNSD